MTELVPCPFCPPGDLPPKVHTYTNEHGTTYEVSCALGLPRTGLFDTEAEAIAAWNAKFSEASR